MTPQPVSEPLLTAQAVAALDAGSQVPSGEGLTFSLNAGTITVLQGPSGCGKSRLLRALADLDLSQGRVSFQGQDRTAMAAPLWRRHVVYLAAESGWWDDQVKAHFSAQGLVQARDLLAPLGLPNDALDWDISRASTGERQRLALLRALCLDGYDRPRAYLLDEPTAALDPSTTSKVERVLKQFVSDHPQVAFLVVSHLPEQAQRLGDALLFLDSQGRLINPPRAEAAP
jgi:ABC-type iron transport system FetAB ATPase subunit